MVQTGLETVRSTLSPSHSEPGCRNVSARPDRHAASRSHYLGSHFHLAMLAGVKTVASWWSGLRRYLRPALLFSLGLGVCPIAPGAIAEARLDPLVERCLAEEGVYYVETASTICYNDAIFPAQFVKFSALPAAEQMIISSPGGNVATARLMSRLIDQRNVSTIIAGPCLSACAMIILPGLDRFQLHQSAFIAVHGISMLNYRTWFGWLNSDRLPSRLDLMQAQLGYDFGYSLYLGGREHIRDHLAGQNVDEEFITDISGRMYSDAEKLDCRAEPDNYWGVLNLAYVEKYLGRRMQAIPGLSPLTHDNPNELPAQIATYITNETFMFRSDFQQSNCS